MIRSYKNIDNMWVNIKKSNFSHLTYLVRFLLHSGVIKVFYYVNNTIYSPHVYTRYMEEEKQYINDNIFKFPDLLTLEDTIVDKVNINEYVNMNLYGNILINKVTKINILFDEKLNIISLEKINNYNERKEMYDKYISNQKNNMKDYDIDLLKLHMENNGL